jgi:hypothetical protein
MATIEILGHADPPALQEPAKVEIVNIFEAERP